MKYNIVGILIIVFSHVCMAEGEIIEVNPNSIEIGGYIHDELPPEMLDRIKAVTEIFEIVDGISFEKAVDMYRRDFNPDKNLKIVEEMARVYKTFCKSRCATEEERKEVYRTVTLRSFYDKKETLARLNPKIITQKDAELIVSMYKLPPEPIDVIQK